GRPRSHGVLVDARPGDRRAVMPPRRHHRSRSGDRDGHAGRAATASAAGGVLAGGRLLTAHRRQRRARARGLPARFVMLSLLVRQRAQLVWNRLTRGPRRVRQIIGAAVTIAFTLAFVVAAGLNAGLLVDRVARADPAAAVQALPVLLAGVVVLTLVTSLSSAFHNLFLAGDLELLMVTPVPPWSFFGLKVLEIWRDSLHVLLFQAAALYGFGQSLALPLSYYA